MKPILIYPHAADKIREGGNWPWYITVALWFVRAKTINSGPGCFIEFHLKFKRLWGKSYILEDEVHLPSSATLTIVGVDCGFDPPITCPDFVPRHRNMVAEADALAKQL